MFNILVTKEFVYFVESEKSPRIEAVLVKDDQIFWRALESKNGISKYTLFTQSSANQWHAAQKEGILENKKWTTFTDENK